jgi:hypothetical protein
MERLGISSLLKNVVTSTLAKQNKDVKIALLNKELRLLKDTTELNDQII